MWQGIVFRLYVCPPAHQFVCLSASPSVCQSVFRAQRNKILCYFRQNHQGDVGKDSSVGVVTHYGLDGPGIESLHGRDFPHPFITAPGPNSLVHSMYRVVPGDKAAGVWPWPAPSSSEVKESLELYLCSPFGPSSSPLEWSLPSLLPPDVSNERNVVARFSLYYKSGHCHTRCSHTNSIKLFLCPHYQQDLMHGSALYLHVNWPGFFSLHLKNVLLYCPYWNTLTADPSSRAV